MDKKVSLLFLLFSVAIAQAQNVLTPEQLWKLGRVSGKGLSKDKKYVVYTVTTPSVDENKSSSKTYVIPIGGGNAVLASNADSLLTDEKISPNGQYKISSEEVKVKNYKLPKEYTTEDCEVLIKGICKSCKKNI